MKTFFNMLKQLFHYLIVMSFYYKRHTINLLFFIIKFLINYFFSTIYFLSECIFLITNFIPAFFKQIFLIFKKSYKLLLAILADNNILFDIFKEKKKTLNDFCIKEKEDIIACIELEYYLICTKWSNIKTVKDAWHIFFRHFLVPLFLLLGTAYIVGVIQHALIGLTYEHFGYVYNGKFPFTKF